MGRPDARNFVGIGFLVIALISGGLSTVRLSHLSPSQFEEAAAVPTAAPAISVERPYRAPPPPQPQERPDDIALAVLASIDFRDHVAGAVEAPTPAGEPVLAWVTHYGEAFNNQPLGCDFGVYSSDDPTIVAVSPTRDAEMPCGTLLEVCGPSGCQVAARKDTCPGCDAYVFDLSESGKDRVCGEASGVCQATVRIVATCEAPDLSLPPDPPSAAKEEASSAAAEGLPAPGATVHVCQAEEAAQ